MKPEAPVPWEEEKGASALWRLAWPEPLYRRLQRRGLEPAQKEAVSDPNSTVIR